MNTTDTSARVILTNKINFNLHLFWHLDDIPKIIKNVAATPTFAFVDVGEGVYSA